MAHLHGRAERLTAQNGDFWPGQMEETQRAERLAEERACFLHPNKAFRTAWDGLIIGLLLYIAVLIPIRIGFVVEVEPGD